MYHLHAWSAALTVCLAETLSTALAFVEVEVKSLFSHALGAEIEEQSVASALVEFALVAGVGTSAEIEAEVRVLPKPTASSMPVGSGETHVQLISLEVCKSDSCHPHLLARDAVSLETSCKINKIPHMWQI